MCGLHRFYCWRHNRAWHCEVPESEAPLKKLMLIAAGWRIYYEVSL
jgi:hypothetical protein